MNIQKQIDAGNRILDEHNRLILNSGDVDQLIKDCELKSDNIIKAVVNAYLVGLAAGERHGKKKAGGA